MADHTSWIEMRDRRMTEPYETARLDAVSRMGISGTDGDWVDFGHKVSGRWLIGMRGKRLALVVEHHKPHRSQRCSMVVLLDTEEARLYLSDSPLHSVESEDPLTLSPEIRCGKCGVVGSIHAGRWVPST